MIYECSQDICGWIGQVLLATPLFFTIIFFLSFFLSSIASITDFEATLFWSFSIWKSKLNAPHHNPILQLSVFFLLFLNTKQTLFLSSFNSSYFLQTHSHHSISHIATLASLYLLIIILFTISCFDPIFKIYI